MRIFVIGASGRVGKALVSKLLNAGHEVTGTTRSDSLVFNHNSYSQLKMDITSPLDEIEACIPVDTDVVYFTTGSTGKNILQVDLYGAVKCMQAAERKGIKRFIHLSALFSLRPEKWKSIIDYYIGKYFSDLYLINQAKLDYTIIQPGYLSEEKPKGKIETDEAKMKIEDSVSIEDVAEVLNFIIDKPATFKSVIPVITGELPLYRAINGTVKHIKAK